MNRHVVAALFEDAFRQVLDDKVFRLLVLIALVVILPTFVLGFQPEGVSLLFGWKTWTYQELGRSFGRGNSADPQGDWINFLQQAVVDNLAGNVGLLFCIAATAFFVPRMLEKGAADTLFSKPVGRFTLLIARYSAGVIFVGCLSFFLVLGMHLGFLLVSGRSDPAFLWSVLSLTYVFALIHCVSVAVAVFTRSSIAAILTTLMFFVFNGCIQKSWIQVEHGRVAATESQALGDESAQIEKDFGFLLKSLDTLHWVLPKTSDADYLVAGLRRSLTESEPVFRDSNAYLSVVAQPEGLHREGPPIGDLSAEPAVWIARGGSDAETGRIALSRRDRSTPSAVAGSKPKLRAPSSFASDFSKQLVQEKATVEQPSRANRRSPGDIEVSWVRWTERASDPQVERAHGFLAVDEALYEVDARFQASYGTADDRQAALDGFVANLRIERMTASNQPFPKWYARTFGWTAPWRYNAFVSIGTSLLFAFVLLLVARWRLARMDF